MADDTPDTSKTAAKPATRRRATRKASSTAATTKSAAAKKAPAAPAKRRAAAAKPRAAKRATTAPKRTAASGKSTVEKATDKVGGKWAVAGGIAAIGAAATAALLSLRGSTKQPAAKKDPSKPADRTPAQQPAIPDRKAGE